MRVADGAFKPSSNGGYLHRLTDGFAPQLPTRQQPVAPAIPLAPIEQRHTVYTALLDALTLNEHHADDLLRRGLHDTFAAYNLFASVPGGAMARAITVRLSQQYDLGGVPGFYREGEDEFDSYLQPEWRLNLTDWHAGYLIPVRDLAGRIQAIQVRRDHVEPRYCWLSSAGKPDGTTSGTPLHFAAPHRLESGSVVITEGPLKAEVVAQYTNSAVIALAGVSSVKPTLGASLTHLGVTRARIAFDMDWKAKPEVAAALGRLGENLQQAGLTVTYLDWSESTSKGLDDLLVEVA